mmetsp:Transcript_10641/g.16292  ORF Transcript_10641/g.16292 Transcript_10641/m.16292 type:complete len:312 (-) Transcript_10641:36-971(-)
MTQQLSDEASNQPFQRYRRRCSVTRYTLDHMSPPEVIPKPENLTELNVTTPKSNESESQPAALMETAPASHEMPNATSRYTVPQDTYGFRPQTRSLSPNPLKRRASAPKITVEEIDSLEQATEKPEDKVIDSSEDGKNYIPSQPRVRRRCSITKYSTEDVTNSNKEQVVTVKLTVEEPADTVESLEHRHMLANDTIESRGAGDLIVGWDQAGGDFNNEIAEDADLGEYDASKEIDPGITAMIKSDSVKFEQDRLENQSLHKSQEESNTPPRYGNYLFRLLRNKFPPVSVRVLRRKQNMNDDNGKSGSSNNV